MFSTYSPDTNVWSLLRESLPYPVAYASSVVIGPEFWIFGGNDDSGKKTAQIQAKTKHIEF